MKMTNQNNTITLDLPLEVDVEEAKLMILLSLFGKGVISSGMASSYLGMNRVDFLAEASNYGMTLYSDDEDSLEKVLDIHL